MTYEQPKNQAHNRRWTDFQKFKTTEEKAV